MPNLNLDKETLKTSLTNIIENIELWDDLLILKFSDCLCSLGRNLIIKLDKIKIEDNNNFKPEIDILLNDKKKIYCENDEIKFYNKILNIIIKFYIDIIENNENEICNYYIRKFNDLTEILEKYKIIVDQDIIDKASIMGSFGKKNNHRKYSLFICTCLIRVKIKIFVLI